MIVRSTRPEDTMHLYRIASMSLDEEYAPEMFSYFLMQWSSGQLVVCGYDNVPIGFIAASKINTITARIMMFAVDPAYRNQGAGTLLLNALRQRALMEGIRTILLEVRSTNVRAVSFYRRHGFTPSGILERFYNDGGNAVKMIGSAQLNI